MGHTGAADTRELREHRGADGEWRAGGQGTWAECGEQGSVRAPAWRSGELSG